MRESSHPDYGIGRRSTPHPGEKVEVLCRKDGRVETLPFLCCWTAEQGWIIADTSHKLQFEVVGWRWRGEAGRRGTAR